MKNILKIILTSYLLLHTYYLTNAQIAINTDGTDPDTSAMLDVSSTDKGILIPRMDSTSRNNISNPATGLMVYDTDENTFWYYNGTMWSEVGSAGAFISENGITRSNNNDDDFVFGADSLNYGSGTEYKFFFDKSNGAFRAGAVTSGNWDDTTVGYYSFASGYNTLASAYYTTAFGSSTEATGDFSTAFGSGTKASAYYSTAFGSSTEATGNFSTAFGQNAEAIGDFSTAFGSGTKASANYTTAFGISTEATGDFSTAFGSGTKASANYTTAFGISTEATGDFSTAFGGFNSATGISSTVFGNSNEATGDYSTAFGYFTEATGSNSTAFGVYTTAPSLCEVVLGIYNTTYTPNSTSSFDDDDRLFVIGNGTSSSSLSDAFVINKNGNVSLNGALTIDSSYTFPITDGINGQTLTTDGNGTLSWSDNNSVFTSENGFTYANSSDDFVFGADSLNYGGGDEYKFFFDKSKGAFRAGKVSSTNWDESNIGDYSTAFGEDNQVSGKSSFATGYLNIVSGNYSTVFGYKNDISGNYSLAGGDYIDMSGSYSLAFGLENSVDNNYSLAFGQENSVSGEYAITFGADNKISSNYSTALGYNNDISSNYSFTSGKDNDLSGTYSSALGHYLKVPSYNEIAIGFYNTDYTPVSASSSDDADRLFVIGNGTADNTRSDALIVYKSGNTELNGKLTVADTLRIKDGYHFPTTDGNASQILTTDGNGTLSWTTQNDTLLSDADGDTKIQVEESSDEDIIRFDLGGKEYLVLDNGRIETINTGGSVFLGNGAGENDNMSSTHNVFVGHQSGYDNTSGEKNTFIGYQSGYDNTTGENNTFIGRRTGYSNTTGSYNVFFGNSAGRLNTTGSYNVFLGRSAGYNETGSNKLYIENSNSTSPLIYGEFDNDKVVVNGTFEATAAVSGSSEYVMTIENTTNDNSDDNGGLLIIAGHDDYNSSNQSSLLRFYRPDGTNLGRIRQDGSSDINFISSSDIRLKENIKPTQYGINDILKIEVKDYNFKSDADDHIKTGFIAQQLYTVFPEVVTVGDDDVKTNPWGVDYARLTPLLVKGMQDQQAQIEELNQLIEQTRAENQQLKTQLEKVNQLEAMLQQLQSRLLLGELNNQNQ